MTRLAYALLILAALTQWWWLAFPLVALGVWELTHQEPDSVAEWERRNEALRGRR